MEIFQTLLVAVFAAGGSWAAIKLELRGLRRDCDKAHDRLDEHDKVLLEHARSLPKGWPL